MCCRYLCTCRLFLHDTHTKPAFYSDSYLFFFNDTPPTEIYTLSLHDALPISVYDLDPATMAIWARRLVEAGANFVGDRKSTRLNSSHTVISYAVFCLKKKKKDKGANNDDNHDDYIVRIRLDDACPTVLQTTSI